MVRNTAGLLMGLLIGVLVVWAVESLGHLVHPMPQGLDPGDPQGIAQALDAAPLTALLFVPAAWFLGTLSGVWAAIRLFAVRPGLSAGAIGCVMAGFGLWMLVQIPTPAWLALLGLVSFPLGAFVGLRLSGPRA